MARATPAILRGASILNLLAAHPTRTFTLTDILKAVKMNRATLHAILAALVEVGYLYRATDKSYMLGPALIRVAHAAENEVSPLQAAVPEIRGLADALDVVCTVVVRERDEMIIRDRAMSASRMDWIRTPITRFPLRPPLGSAFMAWAAEKDLNRWLDRLVSMEERNLAMLSLEFVRTQGYACGVRIHARDKNLLETSSGRVQDTDFYPTALEGNRIYSMTSLSAPVFDYRGQVAFIVSLTDFPNSATGTEFDRMGRLLRSACDRITHAVGGRAPGGDRAVISTPGLVSHRPSRKSVKVKAQHSVKARRSTRVR